MNKLMTHIVAGYPSVDDSKELALSMAEAGVSFIEIQIPFSDPIADGATIARANKESLMYGTKVKDCFELAEGVVNETDIPILFMTYFNIVYKYGLVEFLEKCKEIGVYGLIVPDIPYDTPDGKLYIEECERLGLHPVHVVSPMTTNERLAEIGKVASGLVYCVSKFGLTGSDGFGSGDLEGYMNRVRKYVKTPLALGFGISNKEDVDKACSVADVAVIGSAVIKILELEGLQKVEEFLREVIY